MHLKAIWRFFSSSSSSFSSFSFSSYSSFSPSSSSSPLSFHSPPLRPDLNSPTGLEFLWRFPTVRRLAGTQKENQRSHDKPFFKQYNQKRCLRVNHITKKKTISNQSEMINNYADMWSLLNSHAHIISTKRLMKVFCQCVWHIVIWREVIPYKSYKWRHLYSN